MAANELAPIQKIAPSDTKELRDFNYIQSGGAGDIAVAMKSGETVIITEAILAKMPLFPVGTMNKVMAAGTTATDIYAW
jgi:hypothetical protein